MRESQLVNDIIRALWPWIHLHRVNVGTVKTEDGRKFSTGLPKGFPDLFGTLPASVSRTGRAVPVFIECKVGDNKLSEEQRKFLTEEREKGSAVAVCRSVEDARRFVFRYLKGE